MNAKEDQIRALVSEEAADWFIANREGLAVEETERFATWLKASPVNVEEYLAVAVTARDLRKAGPDPQASLDALLREARAPEGPAAENRVAGVTTRRRPVWGGGWQLAAACAVALGVLSVGGWLWRTWETTSSPTTPVVTTALHFETRHGEQLTRRLADNSVLQLNTDTAVTVRYGDKERQVVIERGEADFEVAHQADKPFRVFAGSAQIVDLGTKFDVYLQRDTTLVTVIEGKVAVGLSPLLQTPAGQARHERSAALVQVSADQQVRVSEDDWPAAPVAVDAQRTTAWLRRQIVFEHEPLERVAAEFNRYAPTPIEIVTPALRNLKVSGVFATDDPDSFIAFLRTLEGVRVEMTPSRVRVSRH
jgi:transmembrane sensor